MESKINIKVVLTILVVSLGYFVDIFDLILFSVVRIPSLKELGLTDTEILDQGIMLLNVQMIGMLVGGVFFGVLSDKKGRLSVLFGSIIMYSVANILNAYVQSVESYAVLRFIAGFGLAGELGIGVTLISEILPKEKRTYGTMALATIGMCGALMAWPVAKNFDWRTSYLIGGAMGLCLLFLRLGVVESSLFKQSENLDVKRGSFLSIFLSKEKFFKFVACILLGVQLWFIMGILVALSPEFAVTLGISQNIIVGEAVFYLYIGVIAGGFFASYLSHKLKSRKKAIAVFALLSSVGLIAYFFLRNLSAQNFYWFCTYLGFSGGYWALFVQVAAEQFGTNLRATVTTSVTNFGRATLVPISLLFASLKGDYGLLNAGLIVAVVCIVLSVWPLFYLKESFHKDLNYLED